MGIYIYYDCGKLGICAMFVEISPRMLRRDDKGRGGWRTKRAAAAPLQSRSVCRKPRARCRGRRARGFAAYWRVLSVDTAVAVRRRCCC